MMLLLNGVVIIPVDKSTLTKIFGKHREDGTCERQRRNNIVSMSLSSCHSSMNPLVDEFYHHNAISALFLLSK